jgi:hypothetical protein
MAAVCAAPWAAKRAAWEREKEGMEEKSEERNSKDE